MGKEINYKYLFSRQDEYNAEIVDEQQRNTFALSEIQTDTPIISEYLVKENKLRVLYPDNKKFAVCLTHDIDVLFFSKKEIIKQVIKKNIGVSYNKPLPGLYSLIDKRKSPLFNVRQIVEIEKKYNANSTFFFLALKKNERDFNYKIYEIEDVFKIIKDNNSEIGLHAGHHAYNDLNKLKEEKNSLENCVKAKIIGIRNHFLKFSTPQTWEIQSFAGFKYDTSYGYNDAAGFRNGLCHPFSPFNSSSNKYVDIMEIPLTLMDCTLDRYMRLDINNSWKYIKKFIDKVEQVGGIFNLLWHNSYFFEGNLELYVKILDYCQSKGAWLTSGENIYKWWAENNIKTKFYEELNL